MSTTLKLGELVVQVIKHFEAQCCVCQTIIERSYLVNGYNINFQQQTGWIMTNNGWCCPECAKELQK